MLATAALALASVFAVPAPAAAPAKGLPGIAITSLSFGQIDSSGKVPALNGVPGSNVINWDVALPIATMTIGQSYHASATFHDLSYTGACSGDITVTIRQGKNKLHTKQPFTLDQCVAGNVYFVHGNLFPITGPVDAASLSITLRYGDSETTKRVPIAVVP